MALEVMPCCGALTHVYSDTVRTHHDGCTGKVEGKRHTKPVHLPKAPGATTVSVNSETAKHAERRKTVRRAADRTAEMRVAERRAEKD